MAKVAPRIEDRRVTYFAGVYRGKGKRQRLVAVKCGLANRTQVKRRIQNLQSGCPDRIVLLAQVNGKSAERKFHRRYKGWKLHEDHGGTEFFKATPEIVALVQSLSQIQRLIDEVERWENHKE